MNRKKSEAFEKQNLIILIILIIFFLIVLTLYLSSEILKQNSEKINIDKVSRVIDGDTFELESGEIVRLICVDTPEENQKDHDEAKDFLEVLILNQDVRLEKDTNDKDEYGRLLRYVYVNISINDSEKEIFVNKEIVKRKLGSLFPYGNDTRKCNEINSS